MNTIHTLILVIIGAICSNSLRASVTLTSSVSSAYLARPGFYLYDEPVFQSDLVIRGNLLYSGIWVSQGLRDSAKFRYDDEFQVYLGLRKTLGAGCLIDVNVRYDGLREMRLSRDDMLMIDARVDFTKVPFVQPYFSVRHFSPVSPGTYDDGWFAWLGIRKVVGLGFEASGGGVTLVLDSSLSYSDGALGRQSGFVYGRFVSSLVVPLSKKVSLSPHFTIQIPCDGGWEESRSYTKGEVVCVGGLSVVYTF